MLVHELKTILDSMPDDAEIEIVYEGYAHQDIDRVYMVGDILYIEAENP